MRVVVTGSIATDYLMIYPGRFTDSLLTAHLDRVSVSFLVDTLDIRRGGNAANICFGLGQFGLSPVLLGAVGQDFEDYRVWLDRHGVDTRFVHVSPTRHTARFLCTTDEDHNQIASFYAGAMAEARAIELARVATRLNGFDLVVIAPNDPEAMLRHTEECRQRGYRFAADPSQQLARMGRGDIRLLVEGADLLFTNEYESDLLLSKTTWTRRQVLDRVGWWITTLGAAGVRLESRGGHTIVVGAAAELVRVDPTGVGDAFRAGFLAGLEWKLGHERAAQLGCVLATTVLETTGPQDYRLNSDEFAERFANAYGPDAASEVRPRLTQTHPSPEAVNVI